MIGELVRTAGGLLVPAAALAASSAIRRTPVPGDHELIQETDNARRELERRPGGGEGDGTLSVWGHIDCFDAHELELDDWYTLVNSETAAAWSDAWLSPDAQLTEGGEPWLGLPPSGVGAFLGFYFNMRLGGAWLVETTGSFFEVSDFPVPGDYVAIGNLIESSGSFGNFDRHLFQPADLLLEHAFNHAFSVSALRMHNAVEDEKFVIAEYGNFCNGKEMEIDYAELQIVRVGTGDPTFFPFGYDL